MSVYRMVAIVRKEIRHILRDPRNLFLVTISPAFLLFLLSYVFSYEVTRFSLAVLDLDHSSLSRRYVASLTSDPEVSLAYILDRYDEALPLLRAGEIDAAVVVPPGFADTVNSGQPAQVQALIDGTDPFGSSQAVGRLGARSAVYAEEIGRSGLEVSSGPIAVRTQAWYNAGRESLLSMVPGLMAVVLLMPTMAFALALTREKEAGTFEGLVATPMSGGEYVAGKLVAYIGMGVISALVALLVAVLWFQVPFRGSLLTFVLLVSIYFLACMGVSVIVANFVRSQQTAMFIVMLVFLVPSFFLAGLITPVSTESVGSLLTSYSLPSTHFVEISRAVFLKGLGVVQLRKQVLILLAMGTGALVLGLRLFRKKVV
jgi:ABC-2 type transport system permease protein